MSSDVSQFLIRVLAKYKWPFGWERQIRRQSVSASVLVLMHLCVNVGDFEKQGEREREKVKEREREGGGVGLWHSEVRGDNGTPGLLAYLCCTPHSCFCCLLLPAKSHPAATWGRRSAPPGPCSSSSARGQITDTNHLLILVIKEILISTELRFWLPWMAIKRQFQELSSMQLKSSEKM